MKKLHIFLIVLAIGGIILPSAVTAGSVGMDPCLSCHNTVTPGIVKQWQESKHSKVGVKCYVCHQAKEDDPAGC